MTNDIKRSPTANCIALHDFKAFNPLQMKQWFEYTVELFREHGLEPIRTSGINKTGKTVTFKHGMKQYYAADFHTEGIWFAATPPNHFIDMFDGIFDAQCDEDKKGNMVLTLDSNLFPFERDRFATLAKDLCNILQAQYGYIYQRAFSKGPSFYPFGVISGLDDEKPEEEREADQINQWSLKYGTPKYQTGDLRDIYPGNILCEVHLNRDIYGQPLKDWIAAYSERGHLTSLNDHTWLWWIAPEHIDLVRDQLKDTRMLLCI